MTNSGNKHSNFLRYVLTVANVIDYYSTELITIVKSFIGSNPELN